MFIHELKLAGLLSFGPDSPPLPMRSLNILVGPNGSGKSNFIEALGLLRSAATNLAAPMRGHGGGVTEWIWKGAPQGVAQIEATITSPNGHHALRHLLEFRVQNQRLELVDERIENASPKQNPQEPHFYYRYDRGNPYVAIQNSTRMQGLLSGALSPEDSILSQLRDPFQYPVLSFLTDQYKRFRLYREWTFGRTSIFRTPQAADLRSDVLEENFSNLGLFLNHLRSFPKVKPAIIAHLQELYEGMGEFDIRIKGGTVEIFVVEGEIVIPASRLSDGTLRFLCLLAILFDPDPPPLICIEEPELGLHPDLLPKVADLLIAASERTQLVVTTHSDILVDAMTDRPECVLVFEKHNQCTQATRLNEAELVDWLKKYRLGQLWTRGQIGGVRW